MSVTADQIRVEIGRSLSPDQVAQVTAWIMRAEYLIERAARSAGVAMESLAAVDVDYVVLEAVVAHVRAWRPESASRYSVQVDDGQVDRTYFKDVGPLSIPDDLLATLLPSVGASGAFTVRPAHEPGFC